MVNPRWSYFHFQSAISSKDCKRIIEFGENQIKEELKRGFDVYGNTAGETSKQSIKNKKAKPLNEKSIEEIDNSDNVYIRDSEVCFFNESWCYDLIMPYVYAANKQANWNYDIDMGEDIQFTKYNKNGFYGWHTDGDGDYYSTYVYSKDKPDKKIDGLWTPYPNWEGRCRKLSVTVNLNGSDDYEGGNLRFDLGPHKSKESRFVNCEEIKPQGSVVVFPSYIHHQVTPVKSGTRYSLVLWLLGKPFR